MDLITHQLPGPPRERWLGLAVGLGLILALGSSVGRRTRQLFTTHSTGSAQRCHGACRTGT